MLNLSRDHTKFSPYVDIPPLVKCLALIFSLFFSGFAAASESQIKNPLAVASTQSPRDTLLGFLATMEERFNVSFGQNGILHRYLVSNQLYADEDDVRKTISEMLSAQALSTKHLDLSDLPQATLDEVSWRLCIQLKEILDRIDLPRSEDIPDTRSLETRPIDRWTIPGTEIQIGRIQSGPKAGQYLFTQDTVKQIPMFFERIRGLPYKNGHTQGMYEMIFVRPSGLALFAHQVIPPRWFFGIPAWMLYTLLGQPVWQWISVVIIVGFYGITLWAARHFALHREALARPRRVLWSVLPSFLVLIMTPMIQFLLGDVIRLSPQIYGQITICLWIFFYLALTWSVWLMGGILGELMIESERIKNGSIDGQLIRLAFRLIAILFAIGIMIEGANRVGLPSYSVIAGLGIGGLAMALAGQQALANLLGSLIIMLEKPFRVGHSIRTSGFEGKVEDIGFRSTRLRTPENTLVVIPSATLINSTIENLSLRKSWRVKRTIYLELGTSMRSVHSFRDQVETLLLAASDVKHESVTVALNQIGVNGFELNLDYTLRAKDGQEQIRRVNEIMHGIGDIAESLSIDFGK